jgi:serine/threonine protein kinase
MKWLSDQIVDQLRTVIDVPDLGGTRYRAVRLLARGGMGAVWLAEDATLHREVALKLLDIGDPHGDLSSRLLREARILARLEHPGIVPVHDAGTLSSGLVFYCMKYVQGQTLDQSVRGMTSVSERLRLVQRIAEPLAFAHSKGVLHRDLKPGNIMIGPFGEVLVMDWGLAKQAAPDSRTAPLSAAPESSLRSDATGVVGTPGYMSPEQARGDPVDERTDIFSLGAVMTFVLNNGMRGGRKSLDSIPRQLKAICGKAMAPDVSLRYSSVGEFTSDISSYLEQKPISAYRENILDLVDRLIKRHGTAIGLVLVYLLMRILFIVFAKH